MADLQQLAAALQDIRNLLKSLDKRLGDLADNIDALAKTPAVTEHGSAQAAPPKTPEPINVSVPEDDVAALQPDIKPALKSSLGAPASPLAASAPSTGGLKMSLGGATVPSSAAAGKTPVASTTGASGAVEMAKKIAAIGEKLGQSKLAITPKAVEFIKSAIKNYESIPQTERGTDKESSLWEALIKRLGFIRTELNLPGLDAVQAELDTLQKEIAAFASSAYGKTFTPPANPPLPAPPPGFTGKIIQTVIDTMAALAVNAASPEKNRKQMDELQKLLPQIAQSNTENLENAVAMKTTSAIHTANETCGNAAKPLKAIKELLLTRGFKEMFVGIGEDFGDNYSPSKYERRKIPSNAPINQIVGIVQPGFVDKNGVPVQKAIVAVSGG